ncbi:flotillin domain-containing protein [Alphaproteobacteria bacterium]|nr:flotillin domain-containing protein [Alphaproteobacteria bacterium]
MVNWILIGLVVFLILLVIFAKFYQKSSKDIAFVRTGMFGQKIVLTGGALAIPIIHQTTPVNMNTLKLEIERKENNGIITKDKMRVDVKTDFYVRVVGDKDSVALAAQTLGARTLNPKSVQELMEGKFVSAMRSVISDMSLEMLQSSSLKFTNEVHKLVENVVTKNGLELESVSLSKLDQTSKEFFDPSNTFDAEGLIKITEETEASRKKRNDIQKSTELKIEQTNLEAEQKSLEINRQSEFARIQKELEVSKKRSEQAAAISKSQAENKRISSEVEIKENQQIEKSKIKSEETLQKERIETEKNLRTLELEKQKSIRVSEIGSQKNIEIEEENRTIDLFAKQKERAQTAISTREAESKAIVAEESIITAKLMAQTEREKAIALVKSQRIAEEKSIAMTLAAAAEKTAATDVAKAKELIANAEALAKKVKLTAEAEGLKKLNEATNILKSEQIAMKVKLDIIEKLPEIIKQSVKPIENIDGIKIVDIGGLGLNSDSNGSGNNGKNNDDIVDRVVTGAMKYKTQAPILEQLVKEVGLVGENESFNDLISGKSSLITGKQKKDDRPSPVKPKNKKE